ncbi:MAG: sigma-70 family RNA polymerase sigma factor [Ruminococcaceae bacterium]|nr:sigma-70 family RNA polymerase sigma factor [Oscillospiraceae bacterium]
MNDPEIIELYWNKNTKAISASMDKYGSYCFTVANGILGDAQDSEECVNDTWLRAWNAIPPTRPTVLKVFFAKITRHLSFDRYKAKKSLKRGGGETMLVLEELAECIADESDVESQVGAKILGKSINRFVLSLSEREQNLFVRRYFFSEPIKSIADRYDTNENNVNVTLSRIRKRLRSHLSKEGYFDE